MSQFKQVGIDFARFGGDESVIYMRQGGSVVAWEKFNKTDPNDVVDRAFIMQMDHGWSDEETLYVADAGGMGQGLMANFLRPGKNLIEFHNGGKSADARFANKISEAWFNFRELVREHRCWVPDDPVLIRQLETRKYGHDKKGKILIETKDEYMKRTEQGSPDRADALMYAFYRGGSASGSVTRMTQQAPKMNVRRW